MKPGMYLKLQLKRAAKLYPTIISITLLLLFAIVACGAVILNQNASSESQQKVRIGLVGDLTNTYLNIGVEAIQTMDASRFSIEFVEMDEDTAISQMEEGELAGYVRIPDDFKDAITSMKNIPVTYVAPNSPTDFGSIMIIEIGNVISDLVTESQSAVYGMRILATEHGKTQGLGEKTTSFALRYVTFVLGRSDVYSLDFAGVADTLSLGGYYVCGGLMFFLLLWGISCHCLLVKKQNSLEKLLYSRGEGVPSQLGCELGAYIMVTIVTCLLFAVLAGFGLQNISTGIAELDGAVLMDYLLYMIGILPVLFMICTMQVFFYEIFSGSISAILFQFVFAVGTGYIAGCFYPSYFFPVSVQTFAAYLPTGIGFTYMRQCMSDTLTWEVIAFVLLYGILFFILAVLARKYKMAGRSS